MGVCQGGDLTAEGGERRSGCRGWVPRIEYGAGSVCTGTTVVGGWFLYAAPTGGRTRGSAPTAGHARILLIAFLTRAAPGRAGFKPAPTGGDLGDWSDWGGGDGFPVCTGTTVGSRGWVPRIEYGAGSVCTGTTVGSRGWVPVCTGTTVGEAGMGSRLHGNDGWGGGDGFPFARERRWWVAGFFTPHLPAGGHVGPPLRLVTRASPSSHSSPAPRRGGRVSNPPLPEVIRVIGVIWERGRDCLNQDLWD